MAGSTTHELARRAAGIAESATLAITIKAAELRAAGEHVIGFGAGEPDFPTPEHIAEAAAAAALDPANHRYTPAGGLPELREAVAEKTLRDSGFDVDASQVVITNGAKHAVYAACQVLLDPGDEVLLPAPYWVTYPEAVKLAGASPVPIVTDETTGFRVTVDRLEEARTEATKMLIVVSPSNPTGAVYPAGELEAIGRWAADNGIWVLTDEIYEHLVYGDAAFSSLPVLVPDLADRCVVVNGVAKTYAMTGWRVGWLIGPAPVSAAAIRLQSHTTSNVSNVAQRAALAAVTGTLDATTRMRAAFDRRRRTIVTLLNGIDGVDCLEPRGAFYAFPSLGGLVGRDLRGHMVGSTLELAATVLEAVKVAFVPGEAFGTPGYGRFSFALGDDELTEGIGRIAELAAG